MEVLRRIEQEQVTVLDFGLRRPTLDDVFLTLTGRSAEPEPGEADDADVGPDGPGGGGTETDAAATPAGAGR
jgi:ABC-2 type transport system ATP-binding protein